MMKMDAGAATNASLAVLVGAVLCLIPHVYVLTLLAVMLPLWMLSGAGVPGLGRELNGFFLPSAIGWSLAAAVFWIGCYCFLRYKAKRKLKVPTGE